jgi:hypothetical protein
MRIILFVSLVYFISGCAPSEFSGKFDYKIPETALNPEYGFLKVYTHSNPGLPISQDNEEYKIYTPYKIYMAEGRLVKQVRSSLDYPGIVKLEKGEYVIVAEMSEGIISSYCVSIEPGLVMEVDLAMLENSSSKGN